MKARASTWQVSQRYRHRLQGWNRVAEPLLSGATKYLGRDCREIVMGRERRCGRMLPHCARPRPAALSFATARLMPPGHERLTRSWRTSRDRGQAVPGVVKTR
jgi:hypothetical protein